MPRDDDRSTFLVSTDWAAQHLTDPDVRFVEVDVDTAAYEQGHMPGAVGFNWQTQLNSTLRRDIPTGREMEHLLSTHGIGNDTIVALYGDNNNWFAAYAFWLLKYYGHRKVVLVDGGRKKWLAEGRPLETRVPTYPSSSYRVFGIDETLRVKRDDILRAVAAGSCNLVDVRSPAEYRGEIIAPPGMSETAQRGGHIPGALNVPWSEAVNEDGTFKAADRLKELYEGRGLQPKRDTVSYCRIGERSSHTWFALKYLVGYDNVRNYDGSWTEYGNLIDVPIEKGAAVQGSEKKV
ncbi:MAG: sulfurtransferase [Candidatus Eremiobacteraeota bacterium]|nr:sulfurtransferase [Candidatus Eremiobacteraeota bacterium]MBC5828504.1 sulfurtransferase [Candidatus Eremiobacteraeota bacterium]